MPKYGLGVKRLLTRSETDPLRSRTRSDCLSCRILGSNQPARFPRLLRARFDRQGRRETMLLRSSDRLRGTSLISLAIISSLFGAVFSVDDPQLGSARVVFQTNYGDIEFGFYPTVAPKTVDHIFKLVRLGGYNTNHFFRVDKGFVAQVADVVGGRTAPMNAEQRAEGTKSVVGEFSNVKHVRGILSMGRYSDPNSATSSFSILLGNAPHLDGQYAVFGKVTKGDETLKKLEELPTRREGIFVMPVERITILSSYYYDTKSESCEEDKSALRRQLSSSALEIEKWRMRCFP